MKNRTRDRERAMFARMNCSARRKPSWSSKAVRRFGVTEEFPRAGWILSDGRMVNSRGHYNLVLGVKEMKDLAQKETSEVAINRFIINEGAVRTGRTPNMVYLEYGMNGLTPEQKQRLKEELKRSPAAWLEIDVVYPNGHIESKRVIEPDSSVSLRKVDAGWQDKAVKLFGTTEDFERVGWILPDGRMIDFSMGSPDKEKQPHFYLARLDEKVEAEFEDEAHKFGTVFDPGKWNDKYCKLGGLRFNLSKEGESLYLEYNKKVGLSPAQKERVKEAIKKYPSTKTVFMELRGPAGRYVDSKTIHNPDSSISLRSIPLAALRENRGGEFLFHKTEASEAQKIIKSASLKNPYSHDPLSLSEECNPYIWNLKFKQPVVLVFEKKGLQNVQKMDYGGATKENGWAVDFNDRRSWVWEKEWFTWDSPTYPALVGVIVNQTVDKVKEEKVTGGKAHGEVRLSQPTKFIPIEKLRPEDLDFKVDDSKLPAYDRNQKVQ
jgi:hypothetical protein